MHFGKNNPRRQYCIWQEGKQLNILTFHQYNNGIVNRIYTVFVRPLLEYAAPVWNPSTCKDIKLIERVQHRASLIHELKNRPYEERIVALNFFPIGLRRKRGDLIECFKIVKKLEIVEYFPKNHKSL
jgi:ribonucleases P/MRP protein subunit RPP40